MVDIDKIELQILFLKEALEGGNIVLATNHPNLTEEDKKKYKEDNIKIKSEIEKLIREKENIIRLQKIKKITNG